MVLPESVFDTTENKYIRLFLYKYFWVRAVVSLPQLTFEPYTSTKTSLLFAQKKTKKEIEGWNEVWGKHSSDYGKLKTRAENYVKVYLEDEPKTKFPSIKDDKDKDIRNNLSRFLKIQFDDDELGLEIKELVETYRAQIEEMAKIDRDTVEVFGHVNTSWVLGEVAQELMIPIFMAEAAKIGYKRSKRGERSQPNELFDIEIAPEQVEAQKVKELYEANQEELKARLAQTEIDLNKLKPEDKRKNGYLKRLNNLKVELEEVENEEGRVLAALKNYYDDKGSLLEAYKPRLDDELLAIFQLPRMEKFKSNYVLIRQTDHQKLLDFLRRAKVWR